MTGPPNDGVKAWTPARSGVARSGATRAGAYPTSLLVQLTRADGGLDDVTRWILYGSLRVSHVANDERDSASFTLIPDCPIRPLPGQRIAIRLGAGLEPEFTGHVVVVAYRRREEHKTPWIDVQCVDQFYLFDARLVTAEYAPQSASTVITSLVQRYAPSYTVAHVAPGLPALPRVVFINEFLSTILRNITRTIGGGFRLDANGDLHAWAGTYETAPTAPTDPVPLTNGLATLKTFRRTYDVSNLRTRIIAEGQRTQTLIAVPDGADGAYVGRISVLPVADSSLFTPIVPSVTTDPLRMLRLGSQVLALDTRASSVSAFDPTQNQPGSKLIADVAPDLNPAHTVVYQVESVAFAVGKIPSWAHVGDQLVYLQQIDTTNNLFASTGGTAWGTLQASIGKGAPVTLAPGLTHVLSWGEFNDLGGSGGANMLPIIGQGLAPVVQRVHLEDTAGRTAAASAEHSDGVHERLIQDGRLSDAGAKARASADLADFAQPLITIDWDTEDRNALPGRRQVIALTAPDPFSADLQITACEVSFPLAHYPPRRHCTAARVRVAQLLDVVLTDNTQ